MEASRYDAAAAYAVTQTRHENIFRWYFALVIMGNLAADYHGLARPTTTPAWFAKTRSAKDCSMLEPGTVFTFRLTMAITGNPCN